MSNIQPDLYKVISQNTTSFFKQNAKPKKSGKTVKADCQLFSQLFISCQTRNLDLVEFFKHENQPYPAALSDGGSLYTGTKSDLVNPLLKSVKLPRDEFKTESLIIDGSSFIYAQKLTKVQTFDA